MKIRFCALENSFLRKNVKKQKLGEKRIYSPLTPDQPPLKGGRHVIALRRALCIPPVTPDQPPLKGGYLCYKLHVQKMAQQPGLGRWK